MLGWGRAFKTRGHYVFNYTPRYYDERKERLEKIEEKYKNDSVTNLSATNQENDDAATIVFSRNELRKAWKKSKTKPSDSNSSKRLAVIIALIFGLAAYILDFHHLF